MPRATNSCSCRSRRQPVAASLFALGFRIVIFGGIADLTHTGRREYDHPRSPGRGTVVNERQYRVVGTSSKRPMSGVNYFFRRVDSRLLLPARGCCLIKMLPVKFRHDEGQKREATELGNQTRIDPGNRGAVPLRGATGEEENP